MNNSKLEREISRYMHPDFIRQDDMMLVTAAGQLDTGSNMKLYKVNKRKPRVRRYSDNETDFILIRQHAKFPEVYSTAILPLYYEHNTEMLRGPKHSTVIMWLWRVI